MEEENELTSIQLSKGLRDELKAEMSKMDTYETFLRKLLDIYKKDKIVTLRRQFSTTEHTK